MFKPKQALIEGRQGMCKACKGGRRRMLANPCPHCGGTGIEPVSNLSNKPRRV